jgi:hypothetical protein
VVCRFAELSQRPSSQVPTDSNQGRWSAFRWETSEARTEGWCTLGGETIEETPIINGEIKHAEKRTMALFTI